MTDVVEKIRAFEPELVAIRRDIHRHPEVGFEETRTAALVAERLRAYDFNDDILAVGAAYWVKLVEMELSAG